MLASITVLVLGFAIIPISANAKEQCDSCVNNADYCTPDWQPLPNLNSALNGIDISKIPPLPKNPEYNPSVRGRLFSSTYRNDTHGNMELYDFITITENLICSDDFEAISMTNLDDYLQMTSQSSMVHSFNDYLFEFLIAQYFTRIFYSFMSYPLDSYRIETVSVQLSL